MIELVPIDSVRPSTYNPRESDPRRLDLIELSLRKLGFLLPIYADPDGEILSGHQRHLVASRMGCKRIPVSRVKPMSLEQRKALNIVFNRGTNDMSNSSTPQSLTEALEAVNLDALSRHLPDLAVDSEAFWRCMRPSVEPIAPFLKANSGRWVEYASNISKTLRNKGVQMPIVATRDYRCVNGLGRLQMLATQKASTVEVVWVSEDEARLSDAMLNLLSMDFDLHTRYRDTLRYNSFRRARLQRKGLGRGFTFLLSENAKEFDMTTPANLARWKKIYGNSVVDFGAGHLTETKILRSVGVHVSAFEPYHLGAGSEIDKRASVEIARAFLDDVRRNVQYTSVFIASVFNSVPFMEDRRKILAICSALCAPSTKLYSVTMHADHASIRSARGGEYLAERSRSYIGFQLAYEPNITLGDFQAAPKVQKYHQPSEFHALLSERFESVKITKNSVNLNAVCARPKPVDLRALREALVFEFDLPYPDGTRMGLVAEALDAFGRRLGVEL